MDGIAGLVHRTDDEVKLNGPRERILDLDSIPFPAWDLFPVENYLTAHGAQVLLPTESFAETMGWVPG